MTEPHKKKTIDLIQEADWDDIYPRAIKFALSKLSFKSGSPLEGVPKKEVAHDIVNDAIKKIIDGCTTEEKESSKKGFRKWDPNRGPLLDYLLSVIKSDISHLYESEYYVTTSRIPTSEGSSEDEPIETEQLPKRAGPEKHAEGINPDPPQSPEEIYMANEVCNRLLKVVVGDDELEGIVLCMLDGFEKPGDIAEQLEIDTKVVNNAKKRLKRIYDGVLIRRK